jgi:hypothetical protein
MISVRTGGSSRLATATVVAGLWGLVGCGGTLEPGERPERPPEHEQSQQPIVGGTRASSCQWSTAVGLSNCTGTLVHPRIITTAGHCLTEGGPPEITFGETWSGTGVARRVPVQECHGSEGSGIDGDFGFCVLGEAVTDVPIVPVIHGCETAALAPGRPAVLAGYGRRGGFSFSAGTKYFVDVGINAINGNDIHVGTGRRGGCQGDSGGPAYVQLGDGTWRVFGATSRGSLFCTSETIYTLIHPFVGWMEATSGIDITPCHDADGTWNPSAACGKFPLAPGAAGGSWSNMCGDQPVGGPSATCGPAFVAPPG